jgi:hypothetical protein
MVDYLEEKRERERRTVGDETPRNDTIMASEENKAGSTA